MAKQTKKLINQKNKSIFSLLKGSALGMILSLFLVAIHRATYSYVPLFTQYILKRFTANSTTQEVNLPAFILEIFAKGETVFQTAIIVSVTFFTWQLLRFILMVVERTIKGYVQERIALKLRVKLFDHVQSLSYHYHNNSDTGDLIQRVTSDVETSTGFVVSRVLDAVGLIFTLVSSAYQMFFLSPTLMYVALATIPIYALSSLIYFKMINRRYQDIEEKDAAALTVIQENIHNTKIVKAFANEQFETEKLDQKNTTHRDASIKVSRISSTYWASMDFLALSQYLVVTLISIYFARQGAMDTGDAAAALMLVGQLIWPVRGLGRLISNFSMAKVAYSRIHEILSEESEFTLDGTLKPEIKGNIEFKNVYFKFPETEEYALNDLNFSIKAGETVAFVGKTGSGKTTIINLLMRMYEYEGSILLDGVELRDIEKKYIRSQMGTVLQNPFLYSRSILSNISITARGVPFSEIERASEVATIAADIRGFEKGFDTMVGERGTTLSGGQKQRVAIARVLVSEKPILIFDDALSAVDNKTDVMIRDALAKEHKSTNLIITHRITTAREANKIIVINNKTVEAIGVHRDLAHAGGLYQKLWDIQGNLEEQFLKLLKAEGVQ